MNSKDLLKNLLLSIKEDTSILPFLEEIIVVDNASVDGTEEMVKKDFGDCVFLKEKENKGFGFAANRGAKNATGDYLLFLNSDIILPKFQISSMLKFMEEDKNIGILGPKLMYPDGRYQRSYAVFPSLFYEIVPRSIFERKKPSLPTEVDSIVGACMCVRKDVFEKVGGFDEGFFFFLEETDLCLRLRKIGYKVVFFPLSHVIHLQGQTVKKRWIEGRIEYHISLYRFIRKYHGLFYFGLFVSVRFLKSVLFLICFSFVPLFFVSERIKKSYIYYLHLFLWHLKGCPHNAGLRSR